MNHYRIRREHVHVAPAHVLGTGLVRLFATSDGLALEPLRTTQLPVNHQAAILVAMRPDANDLDFVLCATIAIGFGCKEADQSRRLTR